jgi:hypothetical protein
MEKIPKIHRTSTMSFLLAQYNYKVNKPIVPTLIHDDNTRLIVIAVGLVIVFTILYKLVKHYGCP